MSNSYDTIVVGLGSAGVTAASTLAKVGKRVLGLEADNMIGGRVRTMAFGDGVVELGAEWIHGTVDNCVFDATVAANVSTVEQDLTGEVFRSDGSFGNRDLVNEMVWFCLESEDFPSEEPLPMGQYLTSRLMDYLEARHPAVLQDQDFISEFLELMSLLVNNYESCNDWNDVTSHSVYEVLDGHVNTSWHRHGYMTFFEILLNTYNDGPGLNSLDIKLNKEVTQIKWPKDSTGDVVVTCKDGDTYTANNVIVTVSLGVLKERYSQLFMPSLPPEKIHMIETISIGVMDKIILKFDQPWWSNISYDLMLFLWRGEDKKTVSSYDYWTTKILGCSTSAGSRNALVLWTSGEVGKMVETLPEDVVIRKSMELLRRFMGSNFTIPEPTGMVRSIWYSNPYTRGSYTYDNVLMPENPNARSVLREPLVDSAGTPKVLFAGEATHLVHFSTVHGASDSGYREASRLLHASKI